MKENEAPQRLYLSRNIYSTYLYQVPDPDDDTQVEYVRKDAIIKDILKFLDENFFSVTNVSVLKADYMIVRKKCLKISKDTWRTEV